MPAGFIYLQESHGVSARAAGVAEALLLQGVPLEPGTLKVRRAGGGGRRGPPCIANLQVFTPILCIFGV